MINDYSVLVTGGAGYIGSHAVLALREGGFPVVVLDNLSTGRREAVPEDIPVAFGDISNASLVVDLITQYRVGAVMHFAGSIVVPDSVRDPLEYYRNNTCASRNLIQACIDGGVPYFVFSSTAAVYGIPTTVPVSETAHTAPINPYGSSKLITEWILRDVAAAHDFSYISLRYFNVAGADPEGRSGQLTREPTHLIEVANQAALGLRKEVEIFGNDYDTPDGTCIRDFVHVSDLAEAHVLALRRLTGTGRSGVFNLGNQEGHSVREVIDSVQRITQRKFNVRIGPRRAGDPECLVASAEEARKILDWRPRRAQLDTIIADAWRWHQHRHVSHSE